MRYEKQIKMNLFKRRKNTATETLSGGSSLTKNRVLRLMLNEINDQDIQLVGSSFVFRSSPLKIHFISSSYANEDMIELNGSLMFTREGAEIFLGDLFNICKDYYGASYRALTIPKYDEWQGSQIQSECQEVYRPLFEMLETPSAVTTLMHEKKFELNGKTITL